MLTKLGMHEPQIGDGDVTLYRNSAVRYKCTNVKKMSTSLKQGQSQGPLGLLFMSDIHVVYD